MKIEETTGRLIAIGDIHGCDKILKTVLDAIEPKPEDTFIFLGDLCNRGPNTKGVFDLVIDLQNKSHVHFVMGNHEEMVIAALMGSKSDHNFWCKFGGIETLASFGVDEARKIPRSYMQIIVNMREYIETDEYIFLHAGCNPNFSMEMQEGVDLRWQKNREDKKHISGKKIVCGHIPNKSIVNTESYICIDTGCGVWPGGKLTALDLKSGTIWQATARSKSKSFITLRNQKNV